MASSTNKDFSKKQEILKELQKLKVKVVNAEKEKGTHIYNVQGDFAREFSQLKEMDENMKEERNAEKVKLQQQLNKIKNMVKRFRRELENVKPSPEFVEKLKVMMEDIESHISSFKEQQKQQYDELLRSERLTAQEILVLDKKVDMWQSHPPASSRLDSGRASSKPASSARDVTKDLPPQVAAFERFVSSTGGVRGGWDEYDHSTFLKYRNRHKGKSTFVRELTGFLPTKTEEEIRHHELWYQRYCDLNEEKKEAIQTWRTHKEVEKENLMAHGESSEDEEEELEQMKKKALEDLIEEEKRERRAQLNRWKVEKELERAEAEERKLRQELEKARKLDEDRRKKEHLHEQVEAYQEQKEEERQAREYARFMKTEMEQHKRRMATQNVKNLTEKELDKVKSKVKKTKAKEEQERQKAQALHQRIKHQSEYHVQRDPSRLLQPTAAHRARETDTSSSGGRVLHMQHRAVPAWRQMPG